MTDIPTFVEHKLTHYQQRFEWDCGLTCVLMVLKPQLHSNYVANFTAMCLDEGFKESTWTIDLCYVLHRFGVRHKYLTKTWGANPSFNKTSYYDKIFTLDEQRVNDKFSNAHTKNIVIEQRTVGTDFLIRHLAIRGPIILLTNAALLTCDICRTNKFSNELRNILPIQPAYAGHYIVLCGYNLDSHRFLYRNPQVKNQLCYMTLNQMNAARTAYGTDEDLILIYND